MADTRKFCGSISVRIDTERVKLELSPAPLYGGTEGMYRVRAARRWLDHAGAPRFFDRAGLAALIVECALGGLSEPPAPPEIPYPSRVSVKVWQDGLPDWLCAWTTTPPLLDYLGRWVVCVSLNGQRSFVPAEDVIVHHRHDHDAR